MNHDVIVIGAGPAGLATSRELGAAESITSFSSAVTPLDTRGRTCTTAWCSTPANTCRPCPACRSRDRLASFPRATTSSTTCIATRPFQLPVRTCAEVGTVERRATWRVRTMARRRAHRARWSWSRLASCRIRTAVYPWPRAFPRPNDPQRRISAARGVRGAARARRRHRQFRRRDCGGTGGGRRAVTVAVRSGARVVPRELFGVPIQYLAVAVSRFPRRAAVDRRRDGARVGTRCAARGAPAAVAGRCSDVPLIGFHLVDAIRAGAIRVKRGVAELTDGRRAIRRRFRRTVR